MYYFLIKIRRGILREQVNLYQLFQKKKKDTEFTIKIKKHEIEGDQDEILCCR